MAGVIGRSKLHGQHFVIIGEREKPPLAFAAEIHGREGMLLKRSRVARQNTWRFQFHADRGRVARGPVSLDEFRAGRQVTESHMQLLFKQRGKVPEGKPISIAMLDIMI